MRAKGTGKKKIEIKRKEKKEQRMVTFSKRRQGLFKKAQQLYDLTGAQVDVLAFSPAGHLYTAHAGDPSSSFDSAIERYLRLNDDNTTTTTNMNDDNTTTTTTNNMNDDNTTTTTTNTMNGQSLSWDCDQMARCWLEALQIEAEGCGDVEQLVLLKMKVEEVMGKVTEQIDFDFVGSFLA